MMPFSETTDSLAFETVLLITELKWSASPCAACLGSASVLAKADEGSEQTTTSERRPTSAPLDAMRPPARR